MIADVSVQFLYSKLGFTSVLSVLSSCLLISQFFQEKLLVKKASLNPLYIVR